MPVTARLLQRLHESLGDDATNDLFAWWEEAATVNRVAVREVADLYFARFEARLEKGLAETRYEMDKGLGELRSKMDKGLGELRSEMDKGLGELRSRIDRGLGEGRLGLDTGLAGLRAETAKSLGELRSEMDKGLAELRSELANQRADLLKWMFLFWAGTVIPLAGLMLALTRR